MARRTSRTTGSVEFEETTATETTAAADVESVQTRAPVEHEPARRAGGHVLTDRGWKPESA